MTIGAVIGPREAPDLHVMTFNIRRRMPHPTGRGPDVWTHRRPAIRRLLALEQPVLLGTQEALFEQAQYVRDSLGSHYRRIGRGRNADGRGEGTPLYLDTRRLRLESWRQLALSDTPEVPGSRGWGNITPRMVVIAELTDRATLMRFQAINVHLDQFSRRARLKSATMIASLVAASALPTIITGDFNTSIGTEPYRTLTIGGRLRDTWFAAETRLTENWGSFPNYRTPRIERKRIDWVLATPDIDVRDAGINDSRFAGVSPSDHLPVQAVVRLG